MGRTEVILFESTHRNASLLPYHRHGISFATIVLEGSYVEVGDGIPGAHTVGSVVIHSSDEEHADYFTSPGRCLNVELEAIPIRRCAGVSMTDVRIRRAADEIVRTFYNGATGPELSGAIAPLRQALVSVAEAPQPRSPDWLNMSIEHFGWSTAEPLREAAKLAGVHPTHFSRAFHRHIQMTPNAFRKRARVRRASDLLLFTNMRLSLIAQECGFDDQSHLTRAFGDALGLSPAAFRRTFAR